MNFYFCETCGRRVTDDDIKRGAAKNKQLKGMYCEDCAAGVMTMDMNALTGEQAHEILKKGIRQTPPRGADAPRKESAPAASARVRETLRPPASPAVPIIAVVGVGIVIGIIAAVLMGKSPPEKPRAPDRIAERPEPKPAPAPAAATKPAVVETKPAPAEKPPAKEPATPPPPHTPPTPLIPPSMDEKTSVAEAPPAAVPVLEPAAPAEAKPQAAVVDDTPEAEEKPVASATAPPAQPVSKTTEAPAPVAPTKAGEWKSCFNGRDLAGWTPGRKKGKVAVKDGSMYHVDGESADVVAALPPEPLEIALEVFIAKGGNIDISTPRGIVTLAAKNNINIGAWTPVSLRLSDGKLTPTVNGKPEELYNTSAFNGLKLYFKSGDAEMRVRNVKFRTLK